MYTREELEKMNMKKELRKVAVELDIAGRHHATKQELIEKILAKQEAAQNQQVFFVDEEPEDEKELFNLDEPLEDEMEVEQGQQNKEVDKTDEEIDRVLFVSDENDEPPCDFPVPETVKIEQSEKLVNEVVKEKPSTTDSVKKLFNKFLNGEIQLCGVLVAYYFCDKMTTGIIQSVEVEQVEAEKTIRKLVIENISKDIHRVNDTDIVWIKVGYRRKWPRFVFNELKKEKRKYDACKAVNFGD